MSSIKSKIIAAVVAIVAIAAILFFTGCDVSGSSTRTFIKISSENHFDIIYDADTKVMYSVSTGVYNCGALTMLVNADGTPKLYKGE